MLLTCAQEITALAACNSNNITKYYASVLRPGTTELMIVMELMACSVADLVSHLLHAALKRRCASQHTARSSQQCLSAAGFRFCMILACMSKDHIAWLLELRDEQPQHPHRIVMHRAEAQG